MKSTSRNVTAALLSFILSIPAAGVFAAEPAKEKAPAQAQQAEAKPSEVRAKVNGTAITREEVERGMKALLQQNNVDPATISADLRKRAEDAALNQLISAEVLYQEGKKLEIKDLDKQVEERVNQSRSRFNSKEDFEKALKSAGLTEKDLIDLTRKDTVINALVAKEVMDKVKVTDEQAKKFYEENKENFKKPETVRASHILISVEQNASPEEKKKAKEKAEELLKKIKGGADFAALAKSDSACPSSQQGGDLGEFGKGQMVPAFEEAAFALKPGEVSGVVETQFGYHII
ncbi:MAG TPA: peptidylprolyl isomerase, partial [Verrucomicrobiae bacterium]|nr:peptidylprolyl isomerase [Verrucomicrobiae bacterium]